MLTINNTLDGYLKDVEIKGNTIQDAENLADIRSVGDKVEGQELYEIPVVSVGKNLFSGYKDNYAINSSGEFEYNDKFFCTDLIDIRNLSNYVVKDSHKIENAYFYNHNKSFITKEYWNTTPNSPSYVTNNNYGYVAFRFVKSNNVGYDLINNATQIEEGTQATPYEPYQEDKLTILSPVQLEKVGDVADRIIEKDGVWGVEKLYQHNWDNISFTTPIGQFDGDDFTGKYNVFRLMKSQYSLIEKGIYPFFKLNGSFAENFKPYDGECVWGDGTYLYFKILKGKTTLDEFKAGKSFDFIVLSDNPTFIPLPHDQQVKLRTFANKTNISFGCEIEGTIKAQVPKSLGATVNTHTEQINNLNKELDRVKKLEESTVSTVETESDFTTVEATSNGYFEDVKLEGKTLVAPTIHPINNVEIKRLFHLGNLKKNTIYTVVNPTTDKIAVYEYDSWENAISKGYIAGNYTFNSLNNTSATVYFGGDVLPKGVFIVEGDHTQNPPSYFEGLKSVGQSATTSEDGVYEISVESVNENLFDGELQRGYWYNGEIKPSDNAVANVNNIHILQNTQYYISVENYSDIVYIAELDESLNEIKNFTINNGSGFITSTTGTYLRMCTSNDANNVPLTTKIQIVRSTTPKPYTPHQSDKKRLLFYNNETQAWEKPVLRQWDSIEKHADGKYYYHQRSGEVVLNGSESWFLYSGVNLEQTLLFGLTLDDYLKGLGNNTLLADKIKCNVEILDDVEGIFNKNSHINYNTIGFKILKSKLSTQDVQGFKQWLQANNVTVVYQLAQEKVYECTNIDLITYANETNYIVECGAISPKSILKVHNNISNVVKILQEKVSLLEDTVTDYMITQNRLMLASRYNADTVSFKVDVATLRNSFEYDNDLYELILNNILVGKDNYNREYIENLIIFYWMDFVISDEMYLTLFEIIEEQHNPKIEEETPLI